MNCIIDVTTIQLLLNDKNLQSFMGIREIVADEVLPIGSIVIHKTTAEVGTVEGECFGFGKCKVKYPDSTMWYPQPKRNILLIK